MSTLQTKLQNWRSEFSGIFRKEFFKWIAVGLIGLFGLIGATFLPHINTILLGKFEISIVWRIVTAVGVLLVGVSIGMRAKSKRIRILESIARTDELTQINNYREFRSRLKEEMQRIKRGSGCISVVLIDLDGFKKVNDDHGYESGDLILREFALLLSDVARNTDIVCRYKIGDEFVVILPSTDRRGAKTFAERMRGSMETYRFSLKGEKYLASLRISAGVVDFESSENDKAAFDSAEMEELIKKAEEFLSRAKQIRNTVAMDDT